MKLIFLILSFWLLFGWALLNVAWNVWKATGSLGAVFFMDPAAMLYPENRKYFWIMLGSMFAMIVIGAIAISIEWHG